MLLQVVLVCMFSMVVTLLIMHWFDSPKGKIHQEENIIEHRKDNTTPMRNFEQIYNSIELDLKSDGPPGSRCFTSYEELRAVKEVLFEKHEQLSRKDKLVVGSEWVCLVDNFPMGSNFRIQKGWVVKLLSVDMPLFETERGLKYCMFQDQFLWCFIPKEKKDE